MWINSKQRVGSWWIRFLAEKSHRRLKSSRKWQTVRWSLVQYFQEPPRQPPTVLDKDEEIGQVFTDFPVDDCPFTQAEYLKAKTSLKSDKSCGEDGVFSEVLNYVQVDNILLDINQVYDAGELSDQLNLLNIIPIPMSGGLMSEQLQRA